MTNKEANAIISELMGVEPVDYCSDWNFLMPALKKVSACRGLWRDYCFAAFPDLEYDEDEVKLFMSLPIEHHAHALAGAIPNQKETEHSTVDTAPYTGPPGH